MKRALLAALLVVLAGPAAPAASALADQPTPEPASCTQDPGYTYLAPPILPASLENRYPDGANVQVNVDVDAAGHVVAAAITYPNGAARDLQNLATAWARSSKFTPAKVHCNAAAGSTRIDQVFVSAASGVTAIPHVASGANFDELIYRPGPCYENEPAPMHGGGYSYFSNKAGTDLSTSVENVFAGALNGTPVAVVVVRCDFPVGFNADARLYRISGKGAQLVGVIDTFGLPAPDDPLPSGGWIHVRFASNLLYVDTWTYGQDHWVVTTYAMRGGKPTAIYHMNHKRKDTPSTTG